MKKIISIILAVISVFSSLTLFAGCSKNSTEQPLAVSFALGLHKNFPGISGNTQAIYDDVYNACASYGQITYALIEGNPSNTKTMNIEKSDKDLSASKKKQIAQATANKIMKGFASLAASTPEVDTLCSIKLAAAALTSSPSNKKLVVFDSGLCTTGLLSQLTGDVLSTETDIIVEKLKEVHALPELSGVAVRWTGLGCVSGSQQKIPDSYQYKLEALWTAIIEASGGTVEFDRTPIIGEAAEGLPDVTSVVFPADTLGIDFSSSSVVSFHEDTVKFLGDQAVFADEKTATDSLMPIAHYLTDNPMKKVLIAGTTANVGDNDGFELSLERAEAVKKVLVANGVSATQIDCKGLGCSENCFRVEDHNADGSLNEEMAQLNRAIYIILADSDTAKSLKNFNTDRKETSYEI